MLFTLGSSYLTSAALALGKGKADRENTLMESTWPKPDNRGTADVGRRNGRNGLEMGSYSLQQSSFLLGCWPWAGIPPDGARLAKLFPWQSSGLHVHAISSSLHLSLQFVVQIALWVLLGSVLRGGCIISHDLVVCKRAGYSCTVTCRSERLQLPASIEQDVTHFPAWLGETDGSTDEASAL